MLGKAEVTKQVQNLLFVRLWIQQDNRDLKNVDQ